MENGKIEIYGYIRVSTREQNEDRQRIAMQEIAVPEQNIYMDKQSGKNFERPNYKKLTRRIKKDDILYIKSIDRLGRNLRKFWNNGESLPKRKELILWYWICRFWTPVGAKI